MALGGTAALLGALDLAHKAVADAGAVHPRSAGYVAVVAALCFAWAGAIVLTRSVAMGVAGGVLAGGAFGNLVSLAFWPGVPNPFVTRSVAFNLADACVIVGLAAVSIFALRLVRVERERLNEPLRLR
jgi:lipoprotein signal peptidase